MQLGNTSPTRGISLNSFPSWKHAGETADPCLNLGPRGRKIVIMAFIGGAQDITAHGFSSFLAKEKES